MFGDNFSGWVSGRMGQINLGRANSFGALVAGLVAGEFLLFREAVDDRRCRCCGKRFILHRHRPRALPNAALRPGLLHQAHVPQRSRRVCGRAVRRHPQDNLRVALPRARHGIRLPGSDRAARHRLGLRPGITDPNAYT